MPAVAAMLGALSSRRRRFERRAKRVSERATRKTPEQRVLCRTVVLWSPDCLLHTHTLCGTLSVCFGVSVCLSSLGVSHPPTRKSPRKLFRRCRRRRRRDHNESNYSHATTGTTLCRKCRGVSARDAAAGDAALLIRYYGVAFGCVLCSHLKTTYGVAKCK